MFMSKKKKFVTLLKKAPCFSHLAPAIHLIFLHYKDLFDSYMCSFYHYSFVFKPYLAIIKWAAKTVGHSHHLSIN